MRKMIQDYLKFYALQDTLGLNIPEGIANLDESLHSL
jgi:hypothetical protein